MGRPKKKIEYCRFCQELEPNVGTRGFVHLAPLEFDGPTDERGTIKYQVGVDFERRVLMTGKYLDPSSEYLKAVEEFDDKNVTEFDNPYPSTERSMKIYYCPFCGRKFDVH